MTTIEFLSYLLDLDIRVRAEGDRLRVSAPDGVLSPDLRAELANRKQEILAFLQASASSAPSIQPVPGTRDIPLSFAQKRLWFLNQLEPDIPGHIISEILHLAGPLDVQVLEQSLTEISRRHGALRTTFSDVDGRPVQVIAEEPASGLTIVDLSGSPADQREVAARKLAREETQRPFDLVRGPLFRATLLRLDGEEHILALAMHHIVSDGVSIGIFWQELAALYEAFCRGLPSPLLPLPIQYADYAVWQQESLQGQFLREQLDYWRRQLADAPPGVELPSDHPRPPVQTYRGALQTWEIPQALSQKLERLGHQEGATPFMTLLAAFKVLLFRLTGQADVVVGTPIAGRNRPEFESLIGFFVNNLVLRTDLSGQPTFLEVLRRVRDTALAAYEHQDVPFEGLLEELQPVRDRSRTPFFQIYFNMVPRRDERPALSGLNVERYEPDHFRSNFDLSAYVWDQDGRGGLSFVYNTDLFDEARVTEMLAQYRHLLEQIAEKPGQVLYRYSLVTPAARKRLPDPVLPLSTAWRGSIQQKFSERAQQTPNHLSVVDEREQWTYLELESWSNRLANLLQDRGIQPKGIVAIYGHRSATLVLAILGVLKAGAAFLVLDPAYPPARLTEYLGIAQPTGWIHLKAAGELPEAVREFLATSSLECQVAIAGWGDARLDPILGSISASDPGIIVGPDDPSCVVFTSGSTGQPKAVLGRHGSLTHFLTWRQELCHLTADDRFAMLSGLAYSPLQRDIFTPWSVGATIYIPDDETIGIPGQLARWMLLHEISFATLTPAMSQILTETDPDVRLPALRNVFLLGDKLTRDNVRRLRRLAPNVTCINSYGSTESQRAEGFYVVPPDHDQDNPRAIYPVGQGMPDVQLLVLNGAGQMAGVGELGEIHIRSPHVALGYLGDEILTNARFFRNPFTAQNGDQLYKMGDLGRYLPDGTVEIVSRADRQVKVRGFRIELGEIETALRSLEAVKDALVLVQKDQAGENQLVAYIVPAQEPAPAGADLRSPLSKKLPDYMVPPFYFLLDELPLTPNRKVDHRALPVPDWSRPTMRDAYVPPRTPVEETLAAIWTDVMKIERAGIYDNFFELGGHSLLATQIFARVRDNLGVELPLRSIFDTPTIADLASSLETARWLALEPDIPTDSVPGKLEEGEL